MSFMIAATLLSWGRDLIAAANNGPIKAEIRNQSNKLNKLQAEYDKIMSQMQTAMREEGDKQYIDRIKNEQDQSKQMQLLNQYLSSSSNKYLQDLNKQLQNTFNETMNVANEMVSNYTSNIELQAQLKQQGLDTKLNSYISKIQSAASAEVERLGVSGGGKNARAYNSLMKLKIDSKLADEVERTTNKVNEEKSKIQQTANEEKNEVERKKNEHLQKVEASNTDKRNEAENKLQDTINDANNKLQDKHNNSTIGLLEQQKQDMTNLENKYNDKLQSNRKEQGKVQSTINYLEGKLM